MSGRDDGGSWGLEVFAATCSGCARVARAVDLPVVCIRAARDAATTVAAMNASAYGSWALRLDGSYPFAPQEGWCDWRLTPLADAGPLPHGLLYVDGRVRIDLPATVTSASFEAALHLEFRQFELRDVTTRPRWLMAQHDAAKPRLVIPRYTVGDVDDVEALARRVDLFVLDPVCPIAQVAPAILRAKASATRASDRVLRHA